MSSEETENATATESGASTSEESSVVEDAHMAEKDGGDEPNADEVAEVVAVLKKKAGDGYDGPKRTTEETWFQGVSCLVLLAVVFAIAGESCTIYVGPDYVAETGKVMHDYRGSVPRHINAPKWHMVFDVIRVMGLAWWILEITLRTLQRVGNDQYDFNLTMLDLVTTGALGAGIVMDMQNKTFMENKVTMDGPQLIIEAIPAFRLAHLPLLAKNFHYGLWKLSVMTLATCKVMIWPYIYIWLICAMGGMVMATLKGYSEQFDRGVIERSDFFDAWIGWFPENCWERFTSASASAWLCFRLVLMDKDMIWDFMQVDIASYYYHPFFLFFLFMCRVSLGMMIFMVVLERVEINMMPYDHREEEEEHMEAFNEVKAMFTDPPDANGFRRLKQHQFIENLPNAPRVCEVLAALNMQPEDLPMIFWIFGRGETMTFRHFAIDYGKLSGLLDDAGTLAVSAMTTNSFDRIWMLGALVDPSQIASLDDAFPQVMGAYQGLPDVYGDKGFQDLANEARGLALANPSAMQKLVTGIDFEVGASLLRFVNLGMLWYQYWAPPDDPSRGRQFWVVMDVIFYFVLLTEFIVRVQAWGIARVNPMHKLFRPWLLLDMIINILHGIFYVITPLAAGTFLQAGADVRIARAFEILKAGRMMNCFTALRRYEALNSFARLNFMFITNMSVCCTWFIAYTTWAFVFGALFFAVSGSFLNQDDLSTRCERAGGPQNKMRNVYEAMFNSWRNTFDGENDFIELFECEGDYYQTFGYWYMGALYMGMLMSTSIVILNLLESMLFVNIETLRKEPERQLQTQMLVKEFTAILKNFKVTLEAPEVTKENWLAGAPTSKYVVPSLLACGIKKADIPLFYDYMDLDKSGALDKIEFLVMYRHIKQVATNPVTTAQIKVAKTLAQRAHYLFSDFEAPPSKDATAS